jgi:hypothetical protein
MEPIYLDSNILTGVSASAFGETEKFYWERSIPVGVTEIVTTELKKVEKYPGVKVYGWIIEPRDIDPIPYRYAEENYQKFEKIYTHEKKLLCMSSKFRFVPCGSCFIQNIDRKIYPKKKFFSMVTSLKKMTNNHLVRIEVLKNLINKAKVDLFGIGFNPIENKVVGLGDYMFSIAVENQTSDFYFTEKIIDCFLTGTIPLYYGCPEIDRFFDPEGIIKFKTIDELMFLIESLSQESYIKKFGALRDNFFLAQRYATPDNLLFDDLRFGNHILDRHGQQVI